MLDGVGQEPNAALRKTLVEILEDGDRLTEGQAVDQQHRHLGAGMDTAKGVRSLLQSLAPGFPEGLEWSIPFDTTTFVKESVNEVYHTLFEAGVLVLVVIVVFLQDWRMTLVPATTVPVTIIGAFAAMASATTSVNMCAASDSKARLLKTKPPTTSATRKAVVRTSAIVIWRALAPAV